jgi:heptosyltransferase I
MAKSSSLIPRGEIRRILVVKPSSIGDVVHALPTVAALRRGFPGAFLAWMVEEEAADIVSGNPHLDEVIVSSRKRWERELKQGSLCLSALREMWEFVKILRAREFDLVIDLQGLLKSAIPSFLSGAPYRLGYSRAREMSHIFLTHKISVDNGTMHAVDRYLTVLQTLGISAEEREFAIALDPRDEERITDLLARGGAQLGAPAVVLHAPARWQSKRWPEEGFAKLGDLLASRSGARIILTGGPGDRGQAEAIAGMMLIKPVVLAGRTSLKELCCLLKRVDLLVTCDSGPMHIAAAMGTPAVALFGPTDPRRTGPYGIGHRVLQRQMDCVPCLKRTCPDNLCLKEMPVEKVFCAAEEVLKERMRS